MSRQHTGDTSSAQARGRANKEHGQEDHNYHSHAFSVSERKRISKMLAEPVRADALSQRRGPGGTKLTYIESWKVLELANETFSPFGWNCEVKDMTCQYNKTKNGKYDVGFSATVRVTLKDGTYHEDVGFGDSQQRSLAQCFENAMKSAVTDARKRALRVFGAGMGNSVYDKKNLAIAMKRKRQRDQNARSCVKNQSSTTYGQYNHQDTHIIGQSDIHRKPSPAVPTFNAPRAQAHANAQAEMHVQAQAQVPQKTDQNSSLPMNTIQKTADPTSECKQSCLGEKASPLKLLEEREDEFAEFEDFDLDDVALASQEARKRQKVEGVSAEK